MAAVVDTATAARLALLIAGGYMAVYTHKSATVQLDHFAPAEFGASWPAMAPKLLRALDQFREQLGEPLQVSPAPGAAARTLGPGAGSLHNVTKHGSSYAIDVLIPEGYTLRGAYEAAKASGLFSGIGVYPDWQPRPGLHLDVRHEVDTNPTPEATPDDPARWGMVDNDEGEQVQVAVSDALGGGWFA